MALDRSKIELEKQNFLAKTKYSVRCFGEITLKDYENHRLKKALVVYYDNHPTKLWDIVIIEE